MNSEAQLARPEPVLASALLVLRSKLGRTLGGVIALALAYYGAAKLGQTLRYTASVAAIWPPAGLGIAALYLWGLRLWPGVFIAEAWINAELILDDKALPFWSVVGQQTGNMLEVLVGAILLRRFIGPRATLDRADQVVGMLIALATATAISAMVGTISMLATGVIEPSEGAEFCRTWWLGDTSGGLVTLPLILVWARDPTGCWRRVRTWQGAFLIATVTGVGLGSFSADQPVTYMIFPALIWAAFRFGSAGATLALAVAAFTAIGLTAEEVGPFSHQPINDRTLSTQLYIGVAAVTTLLVSALVSERERSASNLADAKRQEHERALEERHQIARDLHDSVSQALFSAFLHIRTAERALDLEGMSRSSPIARALTAIRELTVGAQREMRTLLFDLHGPVRENGLVAALARQATNLSGREGLTIEVSGPPERLPLSAHAEQELFVIGREALANVVKHSRARTAWVRVEAGSGSVSMEVRDDGNGFDAAADEPGHYGLESMRSRAAHLGAELTIRSRRGEGTTVQVEAQTDRDTDASRA